MLTKEGIEILDNTKTIRDYKNIINEYNKTGNIDRDETISKYSDFIAKNPDYYSVLFAGVLIGEQLVQIENSSNDILINNINSQLKYLELKTAGKTIEEITNLLQK